MKTAAIILNVLILLAGSTLQAQPSGTPHFVNLTKSQGLVSEELNCLMRDNQGFLWIGSSNGLHRFDGNHFNIYHKSNLPDQLKHSAINDICQAKDGTIWIASEIGMYRFTTKDQKFRYYSSAQNKNGSGIDNIIADQNGDIWVGCISGFFKYNPAIDSFVNVSEVAGISGKISADRIRKNGILVDPGGNGIWLATPRGLNFLDTKTNRIINHLDQPGHPLFNDHHIRALALSPAGHLWMFDQTAQTIIGFSPLTKQVLYRLPIQPQFSTALGCTLFEDKYGKLWLSTEDNSIWTIRYKESTVFEHIEPNPAIEGSIASDFFWDALEDENGSLYFATNRGISICNPNRELFTKLTFANKIPQISSPHNVCGLYENPMDSSWWIATHSGEVIRIDPNTYEPIVYPVPGLKNKPVKLNLSLSFQQDGAIISTVFGAYKLYLPSGKIGTLNSLMPDAYADYLVKETVTGKDGTIWLNDYKTLIKWNPEKGTFNAYKPPPTVRSRFENFPDINLIKQSAEGRLWMSKGSGGFAYFNAEADSIYPVPFTLPSSYLSSSYFMDYCFDRSGNPWFAYINQGIFQYQKKSGVYRGFDETNGLPNIRYTTVQVDDNGYVWAFRINEGIIMDDKGNVLMQFEFPTTGDPYESTPFSVRLSNGNLLVNGLGELIVIHPKKLSAKPVIDKPLISSIMKGNTILALNGEDNITCSPDENGIRINFGVLLNQQFFPYNIHYTLQGLEKEWHIAGKDLSAIYQRLPPGDYIFRAKAVGKGAAWQSQTAEIKITVQPAFYQTFWFIGFCTLVVAALLYLWYRDKMKQQTGRYEAERKADQLAKEKNLVEYETLKQHLNPHFLFNSLSALSSLIDADPKKAGKFLSGLSRTYRYILQNKDKEMVSIDEELKFIQTFLMLQQTRFGENLQVIIDVPEEDRHKKIVPVTLQNLVENAIKHNVINEDEKIIVHIQSTEHYLLVSNNINLKSHVDTSNKQGLKSLKTLYGYLADLPLEYGVEGELFVVRIPWM